MCYDASLSDFSDALKRISKLLSFFIENSLIEFSDEIYDYSIPFEDEANKDFNKFYTRQNFKLNQDKLDENFHYGYLVVKIIMLEQQYNFAKSKI